ncbi:iron-sulfur cluster biosynthesis family protein [Paenibacillus thermoaerophilus]|uniref:Iron-sulfur cluster biosynthesis family protein n=1 Tax=Paenibacillus thermoaerophilus TaxID=1215385 RepID=A0ABW2V7V1_9BACL|nr:iron-sulfur cluster biosynthesis family protein [Paenibacillus thermoaerophilus]TMV17102.1 hypothetical protein FE781_07960 [Paenibacillus thermoaerophilus]
MKVHVTEAARDRLEQMRGGRGALKLVYDSEGCGCAVSGVPAVWIVDELADDDLRAECAPFELGYERRHEVFFEDEMTLDYKPDTNACALRSRHQIYNARLAIVDRRKQPVR